MTPVQRAGNPKLRISVWPKSVKQMARLTPGARGGSPAAHHSQPLRLNPSDSSSAGWLDLGGSIRSDDFSRRKGWGSDIDAAWCAKNRSASPAGWRYARNRPGVRAEADPFFRSRFRDVVRWATGRKMSGRGNPLVWGYTMADSRCEASPTNFYPDCHGDLFSQVLVGQWRPRVPFFLSKAKLVSNFSDYYDCAG